MSGKQRIECLKHTDTSCLYVLQIFVSQRELKRPSVSLADIVGINKSQSTKKIGSHGLLKEVKTNSLKYYALDGITTQLRVTSPIQRFTHFIFFRNGT